MERKITHKDITKEIVPDPSVVSKALNKRRNILGVIIPDLRISFFSEATRGIYEQASLLGYESILTVHDEKVLNEKKKLEFLADVHVDGILLNAVDDKSNIELYKNLQAKGIKIVCWDRKLSKLNYDCVTIDDRKAAYELTSKFIQKGRRNIMYLGTNKGMSVAEDRFAGYCDALNEYDIPLNDELVIPNAFAFESAYNELRKALKNGLKIDGIICLGGLIAYGAGNAILEQDKKVPDDIIMGEFGDNDKITRLGIPFYTVNQNPYEIGKEAAKHLVNCIETDSSSQLGKNIIVQHQIVSRNIGIQYIPLI